MKISGPYNDIPVTDIDFEDLTYHLLPWNTEPDESLVASIRKFGIIHPPLLLPQGDKYIIITGRKRLFIYKQLFHDEKIVCKLVPHETEKKHIYLLLLEEILGRRSLSPIEQIIFLEKFLDVASEEETLPLLEKLGHKPQQHILKDLLEFRSLDPAVLQSLHKGTLSTKNAGKLLPLKNSDQQFIINLIAQLRLGGSKQRKLIELCTELIMRTDTPLDHVLAQSPLLSAEKEVENIPQQTAGILSWLEKMCSPQSCQNEDHFRKKMASLNLPENMSASHSRSFEDDAVTLSVRFDNWQKFLTGLQKIRQLFEPENNLNSNRNS